MPVAGWEEVSKQQEDCDVSNGGRLGLNGVTCLCVCWGGEGGSTPAQQPFPGAAAGEGALQRA